MNLPHMLEKSFEGLVLKENEYTEIFSAMLSGELSDAAISAFLAAWRSHGENSTLLTAGAVFLRQHANKLVIDDAHRPLCDNCGTGGSGFPKFNVSTAAAVLVASCGLKVAKHGNRSVSSKCGSADLLFAAGFPEDLSYEKAIGLLDQTNLTFFFAPNFHPTIKHVMPVRKALGVRTLFNMLGPLANPLQPEIQLLGVATKEQLRPMAEALFNLGVRRGLVVHSQDGLDEISPGAPTDGYLINGEHLTSTKLTPEELGVRGNLEDLRGGDASVNLKIFNRVLDGENFPVSDAVAANAGALLWLAEASPSIEEGVKLAYSKLTDGSCKRYFTDWIELAKDA